MCPPCDPVQHRCAEHVSPTGWSTRAAKAVQPSLQQGIRLRWGQRQSLLLICFSLDVEQEPGRRRGNCPWGDFGKATRRKSMRLRPAVLALT